MDKADRFYNRILKTQPVAGLSLMGQWTCFRFWYREGRNEFHLPRLQAAALAWGAGTFVDMDDPMVHDVLERQWR